MHAKTDGSQFLREITRTARKTRIKFSPPTFWSEGSADFASIWFPSAGCAWDLTGHCFACNYGHPARPHPDQMVEAVALGLAALEFIPPTLWVLSFNFLDQREVPLTVRRRILKLIAATECKTLFSESHPSTVTREAVADCVDLLHGKRFVLEIGVETTNDFIRKWGFGKDFSVDRVRQAVADVTAAGAGCCFNIMVGMPMLSECEGIRDAIASVTEAFAMGAESVVLFPCRIKEHTLLDVLHKAGHAEPTSLLAVAAVIAALSPSLWPRIKVSWITPKLHPGAAPTMEPPIPHLNPEAVRTAFSCFDATGDGAMLIAQLADSKYQEWLQRASRATALPERMLAAFEAISDLLLGAAWWRKYGAIVATELRSDWLTEISKPSTNDIPC